VHSIANASFDAWIKHYRPDENSPNTTISYYVKGAVVAFLLDLEIRRLSSGRRSLDDVMRAAFARYSGTRGFTEHEFRALVEEVAGFSLDHFWSSAIDGTGELEYADALESAGLRFRIPSPEAGKAARRATLGAVMKVDSGRLVVSQVRRGTPAHEAGLNVDDEILAIDNFRVRSDQLEGRLEQYVAGDRVTILVARRDRLLHLDLTLGAEPLKTWQLEVDPSATASQRDVLDLWLAPSGIPGRVG
jgi:predicted metalloprotease with PDZ domain